jgi:hypothetical protein
MEKSTYTVGSSFTLGEIVTARYALLECVRRWWPWRQHAYWRGNIREAVAACRKLRDVRNLWEVAR